MHLTELKEFLDHKSEQYNSPSFIGGDPISIPHLFSRKEDIEISGLLASVISWGNRKAIVASANKMIKMMGDAPHDFVIHHSTADLKSLGSFVHRTFNGRDLAFFISSLRRIYLDHGGLEAIFNRYAADDSLDLSISAFRNIFFSVSHEARITKHLPDPVLGSAAKRMNMFLRWMVRQDKRGVDFGIWPSISPGSLSCPLDVHSGNIARKLGLLIRKQNDARAVNELNTSLRQLDPADPVKYDFALFGLGIFEKF